MLIIRRNYVSVSSTGSVLVCCTSMGLVQPLDGATLRCIGRYGYCIRYLGLANKTESFRRRAWIYALHPLPIIECAWSGHLESLAVFCLAWGLVGYERWGKWVGLLADGSNSFHFCFRIIETGAWGRFAS